MDNTIGTATSGVIAIYYPAKLIECPPIWDYYKHMLYDVPLYLEKIDEDTNKVRFWYGSLHSSPIVDFETAQESIDSNIRIKIHTRHSYYEFEVGEDHYGEFLV